jgi:hypothetical protein
LGIKNEQVSEKGTCKVCDLKAVSYRGFMPGRKKISNFKITENL